MPTLPCLPACIACLSVLWYFSVCPPLDCSAAPSFQTSNLQFDFRFLFAASYWRAPCREKLLWWQPLPSPQIPEAKPQFSSQLSRRAVLYCGAASTVTQTYQPTLVASPHVAAIIIIQSISNPNHFDCHRRFITQAASLGGALANFFAVFIFYFYFFILFFTFFFIFYSSPLLIRSPSLSSLHQLPVTPICTEVFKMTTSVGNINGQHRTAAGSEDDGVDHIGIDTPRSGIATPQPDLQDKRLPSIMSSFGQVRYFFNLFSFSISSTTGLATNASSNNTVSGDERLHRSASGSASASSSPQHPDSPRILPSEVPELSEDKIPPVSFEKAAAMPSKELPSSCDGLSPYPTPPTSQRGSLQCGVLGDTSGEGGICGHTSAVAPSHSRNQSSSDVVQRQTAGPSKTLASVVTQPCSVLASHFSYKHQQSSAFVSSSPSRDEGIVASLCKKPASTAHPTKLTSEGKKSGHSTPTRSLSTAHASRSGSHEDKANGTSTGTSTPSLRSGEQVAAPKGKLTVKITEGRGVRKCRDPYVVAVCQRSELISGGPRTFEDEDELSVSTPLGGVPISRSGSDMGRTPMAIPMRSRQSSNTSVTEYNTFRNRTRRTFTRPKWDAEAVL